MSSLDADILSLIHSGSAIAPGGSDEPPRTCDVWDERCEAIALRLFAHQAGHHPAYRAFLQRRGVRVPDIRTSAEIPAVPAAAFKFADLSCLPPEAKAEVEFHTSGTTDGRPGRHRFETTALYRAAMVRWFAESMLTPEERAGRRRVRMLALTPPPGEMPHSSLVFMIEGLRRAFGESLPPPAPPCDGGENATGASVFLTTVAPWDPRAVRERLAALVARPATDGGPAPRVVLWTTAFALVHLLDAGTERVPLPAGSSVVQTGGFKGRSRTVARDELFAATARFFAIPETDVRTEYGMTELSSQYYDRPDLVAAGRARGLDLPDGLLFGPWWMRPAAADPVTLRELPDGQTGILRHVDLANRGSVIAVQTEDLGRIVGTPWGRAVELFGRAPQSEARGCSLAVEEMLRAAASPANGG